MRKQQAAKNTSPSRRLRSLRQLVNDKESVLTIMDAAPSVISAPRTTLEEACPCTQPLATNPDQSIYTDGSSLKTPEGGSKIGAAIYISSRNGPGKVRLIDPCGKGPTNTINRAELSAIHLALHPEVLDPSAHVTIYTDIKCSIHCIRKMLDSPGWQTTRKQAQDAPCQHRQLYRHTSQGWRPHAHLQGKDTYWH